MFGELLRGAREGGEWAGFQAERAKGGGSKEPFKIPSTDKPDLPPIVLTIDNIKSQVVSPDTPELTIHP